MAEFICRVGTVSGEVRVETHVARDEEALRAELARRQLHIFEVKQRGAAVTIGGLRISAGARKVKRRDFLVFNQQMVALVRAGLPLLQALDSVLDRMPEGAFRRYLTDIRERVQSGQALSEAFIAQGEAFPRVYAAALTAGERSGELATVMGRYLQFAKKTEYVRTKVRAALIYPALLSVMSMGLVGLLMFYILPKFAEFYGEFDAGLPGLTLFVISIAQFLKARAVPMLIIAVGGYLVARSWYQTEPGRFFFHSLILKAPVIGPVLRMYDIAQFCRTLSTLLAGGIPLVSALQTTAGAVDNLVFSRATLAIGEDVRQGRALWDSIDRSGVMSDLTIELVKVGESTGSLDVMLSNVAEFYDEQVDEALTRVVSLFEPIMLVGMGGLVGFLLLAMYLPIFRLAGAVG